MVKNVFFWDFPQGQKTSIKGWLLNVKALQFSGSMAHCSLIG